MSEIDPSRDLTERVRVLFNNPEIEEIKHQADNYFKKREKKFRKIKKVSAYVGSCASALLLLGILVSNNPKTNTSPENNQTSQWTKQIGSSEKVASPQNKIGEIKELVPRKMGNYPKEDTRQLEKYNLWLQNFKVDNDLDYNSIRKYVDIGHSITNLDRTYPAYDSLVEEKNRVLKLNYLLIENAKLTYRSKRRKLIEKLDEKLLSIIDYYDRSKNKKEEGSEATKQYKETLDKLDMVKKSYSILGETAKVTRCNRIFKRLKNRPNEIQ